MENNTSYDKKRRSVSTITKKEKTFSLKEKRRSSCTDTEDLLKPLNLSLCDVLLSPRLRSSGDSVGTSPLQTESPGSSPITTPRGSSTKTTITPRSNGMTPRSTPRAILIKKFGVDETLSDILKINEEEHNEVKEEPNETEKECDKTEMINKSIPKLSVKQPSVPKLNIDLINNR